MAGRKGVRLDATPDRRWRRHVSEPSHPNQATGKSGVATSLFCVGMKILGVNEEGCGRNWPLNNQPAGDRLEGGRATLSADANLPRLAVGPNRGLAVRGHVLWAGVARSDVIEPLSSSDFPTGFQQPAEEVPRASCPCKVMARMAMAKGTFPALRN